MFRVTDLKTISIATQDLEGAVATFRKNFAFPVTPANVAPHDPKTRRAFLGVGPAEIEVVTPSAPDSPLSSFVAERGAGLYRLLADAGDTETATAGVSRRTC